MDLFSVSLDKNKMSPLADRMRPQSFAEYLGQQEILGEGRILRRMIETDQLTSLILYGPPGTGKTSLAQIIARTTTAVFVAINAVAAGVKELRALIESAEQKYTYYQQKTVVFCDEVHRFNKGQQDVLLPALEQGTLIFIGATTENPFFELNSALLSRSTLFTLKPLAPADIRSGIQRALSDPERGLGQYSVEITPEALAFWIDYANGDLRRALNALELAVLTTPPEQGIRSINLAIARQAIRERSFLYDKGGDNHYDMISAMIKSMRGSDPDAALYWFAALLESGEDPRFLMRRIIIHASEDVGLADPMVMLQAHAAANALEWIGLPEAAIPMAQALIAIAAAPKSNSVVTALHKARSFVRANPPAPVPLHLRDSSYAGAHKLNHGTGYLYPHDYPANWVEQDYLPQIYRHISFYQPSGVGQDQNRGAKSPSKPEGSD